MYDILELNDKLLNELKEIARLMNIPNHDELRKQELIYKILDQQALNPSATNSIKDSLTGKKFAGEDKMEVNKESAAASSAPVSPTTPRRKRVIPPKKEAPVTSPAASPEPAPRPPVQEAPR